MFTEVYVLIISRNGFIEQIQSYNCRSVAESAFRILKELYQQKPLKDVGVDVELHNVNLTLTL